ncbi:MAG TPA: phage holin family protein [Candidatus Angelobacter sp.]|nr:phage holin family protein [Candidatus Angelobacter sp.]
MHTEKSIATILSETKEELVRFVTTRVNILKAELDEKLGKLAAVIPMAVAAAVLLLSGWIALNFALMSLLHALFMPSMYAWLWASLMVAGVYLALGMWAGMFVYNTLKATHWAPKRTFTVLKQDQAWLQNEARTA